MEKLSDLKNSHFNILILDGGGSKGVYTLGVLNELELKLGVPLFEHFQLIYGTSTGSIIGSLICLGNNIKEIKKLYFDNIPTIMSKKSKEAKSRELEKLADQIFNDKKFKDFKTNIGIVALNYDTQHPLIFKSHNQQAHGMKHSFVPGFGCSISEAVQASCSAYPIFNIKEIETENQGRINAIDGGYIANNATLFAIVDADKAFGVPIEKIRIFSVGTGRFVEKPMGGLISFLRYFKLTRFVERIISSNTNTIDKLVRILYRNIEIVRISETFNEPEYSTNMIEKDIAKLEKLFHLGRSSYAKFESEINRVIE